MEDHLKATFGNWIPKSIVQQFFNYGNTAMVAFAEKHNIRKSKVGNRVFYHYDDIIALLNNNKVSFF